MHSFRKEKKLKVFIQANCQSHALRAMFQKLDRLNHKYEILDVKPVHLWKEKDTEYIHNKIKECDIFLHQPILELHFGAFASENIKKYLSQHAVSVSFPNLYFTGYHPQAFYLKDITGKKIFEPFDYHDRNVVEFFKEGLSVEDMVEKIKDENFYTPQEIKKNIDQSLKDLRERETHTDIQMSDYIEERMMGKKLFHIFNHPSNEILFELFDRILERVGESTLNEEEKVLFPNEMLGQVSYPVYKSVQNYFNIDEELYLKNYKDDYSLIAMIEKYINIYKSID